MTPQEVREISTEVYFENNKQIVNGLIALKPKYSTKEACAFLGCDRQWLSRNRHIFGGRVKNRRGDLEYDVTKVVCYKRKMMVKE